jgi:hypothetical protein
MSSNVRFLTEEEFNIFFRNLHEGYYSILRRRYQNQSRVYIEDYLNQFKKLKEPIIKLIKEKDIYRKIIIEIEKNNYKYNLFIKLFCSVIDGMIEIDGLNSNGKEYNKYINNKINESKNDLNNQPYLTKKQLTLFIQALKIKYKNILRKNINEKNISEKNISAILNSELERKICDDIQKDKKFRKIIINKVGNNKKKEEINYKNSNKAYDLLTDHFSNKVIEKFIVKNL